MLECFSVNTKYHKFATRAIHAGQDPEPATGAIIVPIYATSTYVASALGKHKGYEYSRTGNPTRTALETALASLEGAKYGLAFASGMAAITTAMCLFKAGDHIIVNDDVYGGTYRLFTQVLSSMQISFTFVNTSSLKEIKRAVKKNSRGIWMETPTNPLLKLTDLEEAALFAKEKGLISFADNTFMTPYFQQPLSFGIDVVAHSTTKYLGGHSDVVGGAILTNRQDLYERLKFLQNAIGATPGPFDSWLVLRGLKTLAIRMKEHNSNACKVAEYLEGHSKVKRVIYPGLKSHPGYKLACKQMSGFGGIITLELKGGLAQTRRFIEKLKLFALAESLGGVESLADHPAIMTHASIPKAQREQSGITDSLVRLSVGIEHIDDLLTDLERALKS